MLVGGSIAAAPLVFAQEPEHTQHMHDAAAHAAMAAEAAAGADGRVAVKFPATLKEHTLANMRDHLQSLAEIQGYLAEHDFDRAAEIAEKRLGMSSLSLHGAHEVAKYMPKGMQDAGTAMHHSASQLAVGMQEAAIDHDVSRALAALNRVTQACVACHAGYRLD
jgi:hypothetical protein